jgi:hypothetical protein
MFLALIGASLALALLSRPHDRALQQLPPVGPCWPRGKLEPARPVNSRRIDYVFSHSAPAVI